METFLKIPNVLREIKWTPPVHYHCKSQTLHLIQDIDILFQKEDP